MSTASVTAEDVKIGDVLEGFENWKIIAPEITPRDMIEHTNNVIAKVQSKLMPLSVAMDDLGIENPEQMLALIEKERSNARLFPADVQANLSAMLLEQQIEQAAAQAEAMKAAQASQSTGAALEQQAQEAMPPGMEDQNDPGLTPGIGGEFQPLVRQTPGGESQALSQFQLPGTEV